MSDIGQRYEAGRQRIVALVADLDEDGALTPVPACPGWTVKDVVAHLTGICADILAGNVEGVATDPWTAAQVESRRHNALRDILAEWDDVAPRVEAVAEHFPPSAAEQWLSDLTTHEHDIRGALARPGEQDAPAVRAAVLWQLERLSRMAEEQGLRTLRVLTSEGDDVLVGDGEPRATLRIGRFELYRAVTGRRSADQIAAFDWDGDWTDFGYLFSSGPFRMAQAAVAE